jgi:hypothetical protein
MKRILSAFLTLAAAVALVVLPIMSKRDVTAVNAQSGCTDATLTGNYGFTYTGFTTLHSLKGANLFPEDAVGVIALNGTGNFSTTYTISLNGTVTQDVHDTGTYAVNSDCTGSFTDVTQGSHFTIVIIGGGVEFMSIRTDAAQTNTLDAKRQ